VSRLLPALALLCVTSAVPAWGQSINVDFGSGTPPSDGYAAAGAAGRWNVIGVLPPYSTAPLVDIHGAPIAADIYMYGGTAMLSASDPALSGADAALMNDMLLGHNDPVDECLWIENLVDDEYEVLIYAMTPNDTSLFCRVRVDNGTPGPTMVGGAWPGVHEEGVTYERFIVHSSGGVIAFHSGLYGGYFQSGMNGVQIRPTSTLSVNPSPTVPLRLSVTANPSRSGQPLGFTLSSGEPNGRLEVFDVSGRLLWWARLGGNGTVRWDGRDVNGRLAARGVLLARWSAPNVSATVKLVRLP
jgi:hypothetical protein